ncbi:ABC transporter substrate-binding protein [Tumebacillus sp. DT12]|uniref:ABC transporter substrate-binding protein n=1 Tax=Tumebacillus lacus TaxID=2995335 RepID=A0ABT3X894_9BACL|nr:nickel ABC transporter substrate-binding protein [Tumebacillus lacus]MCX7570979.1 ABC transporter substrate-binding protein [Tumebacillus lacus]
MNKLLVALVLSAAVTLSGCSSQSEVASVAAGEKKATLLYHFKSGSLDPHNEWAVLRAGVTETLVRLDDRLQVAPWLATKWETKDNRTWVFTIRDGVTFSDGSTLDAAAAKASLERAVKASKTIGKALKIVSMEANGQELTIVTSDPHPSLPSELINPYTSVISVAAEQKMGTEAFNKAPVGTGPFKVTGFTPNSEILLERNESYWDGPAKLEEVVFKFNEDGNVRALALQSKEADIATQLPAETVAAIQKDSDLRVESVPSLRAHFLLFNQQKPLLQDIRVRKAVDLLIHRDSIAKDVMLGHATPANGPFNTRLPFGSTDEVQQQNLDEAKNLLQQSGFQTGADGKLTKDGQPLTLELITYKARPELPLISQLIQSDAAKIGVAVTIKNVENADTYLRENKDWDLATYSNLSAPRGDGGYFLNSALMPGGSVNAAGISNPKLSEVVNRLNATSDIAQRIALTQEAVSVIKLEVLHTYAVYPNLLVGVNQRVTGWKPGPEEYYILTNKLDVK